MGVAIVTTDIGTKFRAVIKDQNGKKVDISSATIRELIFKAPSGEIKTFDAERVDTKDKDGNTVKDKDGNTEYVTIEYTTEAGDINEPGDWQWQARIVIGADTGGKGGGDWRSAVSRFNVVNPIE